MRSYLLCRLIFGLAFSLPLMAQPKYHTLVITTKDGKIPRYLSEFIERKFPDLQSKTYSALAYYKIRPEQPVATCNEAEYYLLGPAEELLQKGCLAFNSPSTAVWQIETAIRQYYAKLGRGP